VDDRTGFGKKEHYHKGTPKPKYLRGAPKRGGNSFRTVRIKGERSLISEKTAGDPIERSA